MRHRSKMNINSLNRTLSISILAIVMLFLANFNSQNVIYVIVKTSLTYLFILFLSGYLFLNLLFENGLEISEILVLSVGASIGITILCGMTVYFLGLRISIANILDFVSVVSLIFSLIIFLKTVSFSKSIKYEEFLR